MFLLDTNVVSELRRQKPHGAVLAWLRAVDASTLFLSSVTLGELQHGAEKVRRHDAAKAAEIELWIAFVAESFEVLSVDVAIFRLWAKLLNGKPSAFFADTLIAATAIHQNLTVVTRNVADFQYDGLPVFDPFGFGSG